MAKNLLVTLLVCLLPLGANQIIARTTSLPLESTPLNFDGCDAPPPDSFRVTNISSEAVDLVWIPVSNGAEHTLVVSIEDGSGGFTNLATYYSVPGSSFTLTGLSPGSYKISNATNCPNGETSFKNSEVRFKLIELTTAGRVPVNPVAVSNCGQIDYLNHKWVGFKVKEIATGRSNLFEFKVEGSSALVRRVANNQIVAVNGNGIFPIGNQRLMVGFSFQMDDKNKPNGQQTFGFIKISPDSSGIIGICIDINNPNVLWKPEFEFSALTAEAVMTSIPPGGGGAGLGLSHTQTSRKFTVQSLFTDNLKVFINEEQQYENEGNIFLIDMNGQIVLSQKLNLQNQTEFISTESLFPGLYILQIKSDQDIEVFKILKI